MSNNIDPDSGKYPPTRPNTPTQPNTGQVLERQPSYAVLRADTSYPTHSTHLYGRFEADWVWREQLLRDIHTEDSNMSTLQLEQVTVPHTSMTSGPQGVSRTPFAPIQARLSSSPSSSDQIERDHVSSSSSRTLKQSTYNLIRAWCSMIVRWMSSTRHQAFCPGSKEIWRS